MAAEWSSSAMTTCDPNEIWDGSVPVYSPGLFPDESRRGLNHYFPATDNGENPLPSLVSEDSSLSPNSMMDISPSTDSMIFTQSGVTSPHGFYHLNSQFTDTDEKSKLTRSGNMSCQPGSYFGDKVVIKPERKLSSRQSKRNRNATWQARRQVSNRRGTSSQRRRSFSGDESNDECDIASTRDDNPHHQTSRGRGRLRSNGRLPHNQVERKYREGINSQLEALRQSLPSLQRFPSSISSEGVDEANTNNPPLARPSKATILATATAYIKQIEGEKQRLADENRMLMYSIISPSSLC